MVFRFSISFCALLVITVICAARETSRQSSCHNDLALLRDNKTGKPVIFKDEELRTKLIVHERPDFPLSCRCSGNVIVRFVVNINGEVVCADVISGHPLLRASVDKAIRNWKFAPTIIEGNPYSITGIVSFGFRSEGFVYDNILHEDQYCQLQDDNFLKHSIYPDELTSEKISKLTIHRVIPVCPASIRCETNMTVDVDVNPQGKVECITLPKHGHPLLKVTVANAVRRWRFKPLKKRGKSFYFNGQVSVPIKSQP